MPEIPKWYRQADQLFKQSQDRLQQEAVRNSARFEIKDSPTGWALLPEYPMYQVVPDAQYPWDVDIVKAMRTIDPRVVPLWVTWAYKPPIDCPDKGVYVTGRHAIGLANMDPKIEQQDFSVLMPTTPIGGMTFKRPTVIHKIYHVAPETDERIGGFVPYSWWMYYNLREEYVGDKSNPETGKEYITRLKEEWEQKQAARSKEQSYIFSDVNKFATERLNRTPEQIIKEWMLGANKMYRPS